MPFKLILFLVTTIYSINLQGNVSFVKHHKDNRAYPQNVNYKIETYSQNSWTKKNALFNDFIRYSPPVKKVKRKIRKKRYKKTKQKKESTFWSSLWHFVILPIITIIMIPLIIGAIFSPLVFVILGVNLVFNPFLILAIIMLAALLIASTLFYLIVRGYALFVSLIANAYLLILSLVFLIWGAILAFPILWIGGLILLLAILGLSLLIYLMELG